MMAQTVMRFDGQTYDAKRDGPRLTGNLLKLKSLMVGGQWFKLSEVAAALGCTETAASARLRDLRKPRFGSHTVERKNLGGGIWVYRVMP
jgi:hypothetical protein